MKLKRKLILYDFSSYLGVVTTVVMFGLSVVLGLYLLKVGVVSTNDSNLLIGILLLMILLPIYRRIGVYVEDKTLEKCIKFLEKLVDSGDLLLHIEDRVVVENIKKEALTSKFFHIKIYPRWYNLKDRLVDINLHKLLLKQPDVKKLIVTKRYYEIKKVDFKYYAVLKNIVDKAYKEEVKII